MISARLLPLRTFSGGYWLRQMQGATRLEEEPVDQSEPLPFQFKVLNMRHMIGPGKVAQAVARTMTQPIREVISTRANLPLSDLSCAGMHKKKQENAKRQENEHRTCLTAGWLSCLWHEMQKYIFLHTFINHATWQCTQSEVRMWFIALINKRQMQNCIAHFMHHCAEGGFKNRRKLSAFTVKGQTVSPY